MTNNQFIYERKAYEAVKKIRSGSTAYLILCNGCTFSDNEGICIEKGATLSLKSETTLSLYFTSSEKLTFSMDGKTVETANNGGTQDGKLINAVKALYQYSYEANEYFK